MGSICVALRDPFPFAIHEAQVVLRPGEVTVSSALAPCESFNKVIVGVVAEAEVGLGVGVALLCGFALPIGGLGVVLWQAPTRVVQGAEEVLRLGMALLGGESEAGCGFGEVAGVVVSDSLPVVRVRGRVGCIAAAAGDDARARGMERQSAAGRDVLQAGFGFIFDLYLPCALIWRSMSSKRRLASTICSRRLAASSVSRSRCSRAAASASRYR